MKKVLALLLSVAMVFSLAACQGAEKKSTDEVSAEIGTVAKETADAPVELKFDPDKAPEDYSGTLTLYSPQDSEPLNAVINLFEAKYPNVTVSVVSDGAGALMARLGAEKENPTADVVWTISNEILDAYADCLQPYKPTDAGYFDETLCGPDYLYIGDNPMLRVFIYNTDLIPEEEVPTSWAELAEWDVDKYGYIAMADPTSSSGALAILNTILMALGTKENNYEEGWATVEAIIPKLSIQSSSSGPYKNVVAGEYALGLTGERQAVQFDDPVKHLYPSDGTSVVSSGIAIVKNCPNPELAVIFEEFVLGKDIAELLANDYYFRPTRNDVSSDSMPALSTLNTVNYDYEFASSHSQEVQERWKELIVKFGV